MSIIIFVRHGESEGNKAGVLTGLADVPLTNIGKKQARKAGEQLQGITFDSAYTSNLRRAQETLSEILNCFSDPTVLITTHHALNERDFGTFTGMDKNTLQASLGETGYRTVIKGWDIPAPEGESLRDVQERVVAYFKTEILPKTSEGKNVLVVSHHQTLRALLKHIENIPDSAISGLELENAEPIAYRFDATDGLLTRFSL